VPILAHPDDIVVLGKSDEYTILATEK